MARRRRYDEEIAALDDYIAMVTAPGNKLARSSQTVEYFCGGCLQALAARLRGEESPWDRELRGDHVDQLKLALRYDPERQMFRRLEARDLC
jgi:hypothetical protein